MLVTSVVRRVTGPRWRTCRYWKRNNPECRPEHRLAQIGGQTRAGARAVNTRANAADHRQNRHHGHQRTDLRDVLHVAHGDALVDDGRGEIRNQNFKHDAQRRIHRRKQRVFFVLPDLLRNARTGDMLLFCRSFFLQTFESSFFALSVSMRSSSMQSSCLNSGDDVISNTRPRR